MSKDILDLLKDTSKYSEFQVDETTKRKQIEMEKMDFEDDLSFERTARFFASSMLSTGILSLLTAPLTTTYISLQLSPLNLKNRFISSKEHELKLLNELPNDKISAQNRKKIELMIRTGVTGRDKPFKPPTFLTYSEVFQALGNQGLKGFYKGNFIGLAHFWLSNFAKLNIFNYLESRSYFGLNIMEEKVKFLLNVCLTTSIDILLNPIQTLQSRFILQDRNPKFATYKSIFDFMRANKGSKAALFQGVAGHLPKNILLNIGVLNLMKERPIEGFIVSSALSQILTYPINLVIRRLQCQSPHVGMLPKDLHKGFLSAFPQIYKEEGVKGYFRGIGAFLVVNIFTMTLMIQANTRAGES